MDARRVVQDFHVHALRPDAAHRGLPAEVSGFAGARWRAGTKQAEQNYEQAKAQTDRDYEETAAAVAEKKQLTAEEEAELSRLWKKLVKLYHPDRFANQPDKLETYHMLTAAINRAKDAGEIQTLREIAEDPHDFILRQV